MTYNEKDERSTGTALVYAFCVAWCDLNMNADVLPANLFYAFQTCGHSPELKNVNPFMELQEKLSLNVLLSVLFQ